MSDLAWGSWGLWLLIVTGAMLFRSRAYAIFRAVLLGIHCLVALALMPYAGQLRPLFIYLHLLVFLDAAVLIVPRLRPTWYRVLFSLPAQYMAASTFMAFPWAIASAFGFRPWGLVIPYLLGMIGLVQSLTARREEKKLIVGQVEPSDELVRVTDVETGQLGAQRPLRIAQITDPHLGPFMPVGRLRAICQRVVDQEPDLVLLTGDFLTMESQASSQFLSAALAPLSALDGRVFACMGNHDHEAPAIVRDALRSISATLLIDESRVVSTPVGPVQILGLDFHFRDRKNKILEVCAWHPKVDGCLRLVLLHDPGAFKYLPEGEADLVLSGHTHGGQVGLVSIGFAWTIAGAVAKIPDHGFWANGTNRLYVHRGTGHYGFPLRLGVPAEESILAIYQLQG